MEEDGEGATSRKVLGKRAFAHSFTHSTHFHKRCPQIRTDAQVHSRLRPCEKGTQDQRVQAPGLPGKSEWEEPTFCGASCSGTSHSSSEAAGSCMPSNCFRRPMATASADVECRKQWELGRREPRRAEGAKSEDWRFLSGPETTPPELDSSGNTGCTQSLLRFFTQRLTHMHSEKILLFFLIVLRLQTRPYLTYQHRAVLQLRVLYFPFSQAQFLSLQNGHSACL